MITATEKLFEQDVFLTKCQATVLSCEPYKNDTYSVVLNATVFYPEGGGQPCDKGTLGGLPVSFVYVRDGVIYHVVPQPFEVGQTVNGEIDPLRRLDFMQQHTGEHITTGLAFRMFEANNVGFHLSEATVMLDVDKVLDEEEILLIENMANDAIYKNIPVRAWYPDDTEMQTLAYRSKEGRIHGEDVRIVEIPECDLCACCGTHLPYTGQVGVIKILDFYKHRGGTRIIMAAGKRALEDYRTQQGQVKRISALLSAKPELVADATERILQEQENLRLELSALKSELITLKLKDVAAQNGVTFYTEANQTPDTLRRMALALLERGDDSVCAVFSADENGGYKYAVGSNKADMRTYGKEMNTALNGKGGGSKELIQGSVSAGLEEIKAFFGV